MPAPTGFITQKVELLINGTWTDITQYVYQRDPVVISGAEQSGTKQIHQSSQMTFTLNNRDARFTPTNASGPYYPYLQRNTQIRYSIVKYLGYTGYRFWGLVSSWPMTADSTGTDVYEQITANGPLREINQGGGWGAALTRYYQRLTGSKVPNFYVPCEEGYKSGIFAAGITGTPNFYIPSGTPGMSSRSTFNGSAPLPQPERTTWIGTISDTTAATSNYVRWVQYVPPYGGNNGAVLMTIATHGTISKAYIKYHAGGKMGMRLWNGTTKIADSGAFYAGTDGRNVIVSVEFVQSGSNINWAIYVIYPGEKKAHASASGTVAGTVSYVTSITVDQDKNVTNTAIGHVSNQRAADALHVVADSLNGNQDEMSVDRFVRIAGEQALNAWVQYNESVDHWGFEKGVQGWGANNGTLAQSQAWSSEGSSVALATGAYVGYPGMGYNSFSAGVSAWNTWTGDTLGTVRIYLGASNFSYSGDLQAAVTAGYKVCLTLRPAYNPTSSTDLANMTTLLNTLQSNNANIEITLWHEPYYQGLTSTQYINMVQYYGPTVRQYYPLVFCTANGSVTNNNENSYYPGDSYIDKIATDFYCINYVNGQTLDLAASIADNAVPPKPFGIWEYNALVNGGNWLPQPNSGFEDNASGSSGTWTAAGNCTAAVSNAFAHSGSYSYALTCTTAGNIAAAHCTVGNILTQGMPCSPGDQISTSAWFRPGSTTRSVQANVDFFNSSGTNLGTTTITAVAETSGAWTQSSGTITAPANAAYCRANPQVQSAALSEVHYVDDIFLSNLSTGYTTSQCDAFFQYIQSFMSWRANNYLANADVLMFVGNGPNCTQIQSSSDFRIAQYNKILGGTGGGNSLVMTANGAGAPSAFSPTGTSGQPVVAGDMVNFAVDVYAPAATAGTISAQIGWFNSSGTSVGTSIGTGYVMAAGDALTLWASDVAPAGAAYFNCHVLSSATEANGTLIYTDHVRISSRLAAQLRGKYKQMIKEIRDAEQAVIRESRSTLGLEFRTRIYRTNQPVSLTLSYTSSALSAMPAPVLDDVNLANDITISRHKGSKINVQVSSGANSVNYPPNGLGRYAKKYKRLLADDRQLLAYASHLLNINSNISERYPSIQVAVHRSSVSSLVSAIAAIATGDRINVTNLPAWFPNATADQIVQGYTETITPFTWDIDWNCSPYQPWSVSLSQIRRW